MPHLLQEMPEPLDRENSRGERGLITSDWNGNRTKQVKRTAVRFVPVTCYSTSYNLMERTPKMIAGFSIVVLIATGLGTYAYFQSREYLRGPVLTITEPIDGSMSTTSLVVVRGSARNVSFLTLNGRPIFTDEQGRLTESLLLQKGYSIMTFEAKDRFGHTAEKRLELVYKPIEKTNDSPPTINNDENP